MRVIAPHLRVAGNAGEEQDRQAKTREPDIDAC
jgi:hypothetical protein